MHPFPTLLILFLTCLGYWLPGQDVGYYLNEMNTDPGIDATFNAEIDTIWARSMRENIDSTNYAGPVHHLQEYYDAQRNVITGDKAELYAYFLLFKHGDYPSIISRFEEKIGDYDHRAFTTIGELHRRSLGRHYRMNLTEYMDRMDSLAALTPSVDFQAYNARMQDLQEGQRAPAFTLTDLQGKEYDLDALAGKVVVLDFWATWCPPCVAELPAIKALYEEFKGNDDFVLISVSLDNDAERLQRFVERNALTWPQVKVHDGKVTGNRQQGEMATTYKAVGLPKYILIDKDGVIRYNSHLNNQHFVPVEVVNRYL